MATATAWQPCMTIFLSMSGGAHLLIQEGAMRPLPDLHPKEAKQWLSGSFTAFCTYRSSFWARMTTATPSTRITLEKGE